MKQGKTGGDVTFTIHNKDVMDGFKQLDDECIDLIVTSPPYNVGIEYDKWNDSLPAKDYYNWVEKWLLESYRVLKPDGRIAINIPFEVNMKKSNDGRVFILVDYWNIMRKVGFNFFGLVRLNELSSQRVKYTAWGSWLSPSQPYIYLNEECVILAYKLSSKKLNKGESDLTKDEFIEYVSGVWNYQAETRGLTMANFSLDIPMKAIKILSWKGETVLDPFTGSGTTGVAAIKLGRKFIGFEISSNYHKIALDRVQHAVDKTKCSLRDMIE